MRPFYYVPIAMAIALSAQGQETAPRVDSATLANETQILKTLGDQQRWFTVLNRSTRLLRTFPESPELLLFQTTANKELGRNEQTRKLAEEFLVRFPDSINKDQALFLLGSALLLSGTRVEAASMLLEASRVTEDATLKQQIRRMLPPEKNPIRIGLSLGGRPPETPEEVEKAARLEERIIEIAVEEFTQLHGHPPDLMEELLQGDPPILRALPEDPRRPGSSLPFKRTVKTPEP